MDNDSPITRADLTAALTVLENRILERIEKSETNLLNAFRIWARRSDTRMKANRILVNSFDERLGDLEDQVAEIKDKIR